MLGGLTVFHVYHTFNINLWYRVKPVWNDQPWCQEKVVVHDRWYRSPEILTIARLLDMVPNIEQSEKYGRSQLLGMTIAECGMLWLQYSHGWYGRKQAPVLSGIGVALCDPTPWDLLLPSSIIMSIGVNVWCLIWQFPSCYNRINRRGYDRYLREVVWVKMCAVIAQTGTQVCINNWVE